MRGEAAATCLPREAVPYDYQAVGPFVGCGDPAPVFADAEAGDDVGVALQTWREVALRQRFGGPSPGTSRKGGAPEAHLSSLSRCRWLKILLPPALPGVSLQPEVSNFPSKHSQGKLHSLQEQRLPRGRGVYPTLNPRGE